MRRAIGISIFVILLVAGGIAAWMPLRKIADGDITAAFASDLSEYITKHNGSLPANWDYFSQWMKEEKGSNRWKASELNDRFSIQIFHIQKQESPPVYIRVKDQDISEMQDYINRQIHYSNNG